LTVTPPPEQFVSVTGPIASANAGLIDPKHITPAAVAIASQGRFLMSVRTFRMVQSAPCRTRTRFIDG
jgi:hypothetical protein